MPGLFPAAPDLIAETEYCVSDGGGSFQRAAKWTVVGLQTCEACVVGIGSVEMGGVRWRRKRPPRDQELADLGPTGQTHRVSRRCP